MMKRSNDLPLDVVHGFHEDLGLPVDESHVLDDLVLGVEQLDALRVRVVARREGARVRRGKLPATRQCIMYDQCVTTLTYAPLFLWLQKRFYDKIWF